MIIREIKPLFTRVLTTARVYTRDELEGKIIDLKQVEGALKEYQEVLAVGDAVRDIKVGDLVKIDPTNYAKRKYKEGTLKDGVVTSNPVVTYEFNVITVDEKPCLLIHDRDIEFIITKKEEEKEQSKLIHPNSDIIL